MRIPDAHRFRRSALTLALAVSFSGLAEAAAAHRSAPAPRGGGSRASAAPRSSSGSRASGARTTATRTAAAPRQTASRGTVPPRQTASGTARYGYGYGSYGYPSYPYYPYYPSYGWPYYGSCWGWGCYGDYWYGWPTFGFSVGVGYGPEYVYGAPVPEGPYGPAILETDVSPSKAEVILDGVSAGLAKDFNGTWDELRVEPGRHTITFRKEDHRSLTVTFDAAPGGRYVFDQALAPGEGEERIERLAEPAAPSASAAPVAPAGIARGFLRIRVQPEDAVVYLDGEYLGSGRELAALHGALAVAQGEHVVEVTRPGFRNASRTVLVGADAPVQLEVTLEPSPPQP